MDQARDLARALNIRTDHLEANLLVAIAKHESVNVLREDMLALATQAPKLHQNTDVTTPGRQAAIRLLMCGVDWQTC